MDESKKDVSIVWRGEAFDTTEVFNVTFGKTIKLRGDIRGNVGHAPVDVTYAMKVDEKWVLQSIRIEKRSPPAKVITLRKDTANVWHDGDGNHLSMLDGCIDVDLSLSPSTNSLPINRLHFEPGATHKIKVAYVDLQKLEIFAVDQSYSHVRQNVFHYENKRSGFQADLLTDNQGFVIHYPGVWRRVAPSETP